MPFTLLGEPLVFWKDTVSGEYRCTADKCPHRLVPLSEGRVNEKGEIECGYHGWTFDGKARVFSCSCSRLTYSTPPVCSIFIRATHEALELRYKTRNGTRWCIR